MQLLSSPMAIWKLFVCLTFALIFTSPTNSIPEGNPQSSEFSGSSLRAELDQLKSRISALESSVGWTTRALEKKDYRITELENIIQEKSRKLASLQDEIEFFQDKRSVDAAGKVEMTQTSSVELESQVENLREEIQVQNIKKLALRARSETAEDKMHQLNMKLKNLQKINDEQRTIIRKTERALQVAEEELVNTKMEAASISDELQKIPQSWLPRSVAVHVLHCQNFIAITWNKYGRPVLKPVALKASKIQDESLRLATPYIREIKKDFVEPWARLIMTKATELYFISKTLILPHFVRMQTLAYPYLQETKRLCKPCTDQLVLWFRPHLDKAQVFLKPYTKIVVWAYGKVKKSVIAYHWQVRAAISEKLLINKLADPQLADDVAWFGAAAFVALPVALLLSKVVSGVLRTKPKKRVRHRQHHHTRRRAKRSHSDGEK